MWNTSLPGKFQQVCTSDPITHPADIQMMLSPRPFAESQVERRSQLPLPVLREPPCKVARMVVPVMEKDVEHGPCIGLLHFTFISRQHPGGAQQSRIVRTAWQSEVHLQQAGKTMHGNTHAALPVETAHTKGRQSG